MNNAPFLNVPAAIVLVLANLPSNISIASDISDEHAKNIAICLELFQKKPNSKNGKYANIRPSKAHIRAAWKRDIAKRSWGDIDFELLLWELKDQGFHISPFEVAKNWPAISAVILNKFRISKSLESFEIALKRRYGNYRMAQKAIGQPVDFKPSDVDWQAVLLLIHENNFEIYPKDIKENWSYIANHIADRFEIDISYTTFHNAILLRYGNYRGARKAVGAISIR